jgi:predicted ATPase
VNLLERDEALSALVDAFESARNGVGKVVLVTGEAGIGKTSLVQEFLSDVGSQARILIGVCDDLAVPRPLGPLLDLDGEVSLEYTTAFNRDVDLRDAHSLVLAELERLPTPAILVIEDVRWADEATLDVVTVLGRRISSVPAVLLLTFRPGDVPHGHRLLRAIGGFRSEDSVHVELEPLSFSAVETLAGARVDEVFRATAGNPFYVTEMVAAGFADGVPASIATTLLGRVTRLDNEARRLIEIVSMVPARMNISVLDLVMPEWMSAATEPERQALLEVDTGAVRFRHELARHVVEASVPAAVQRQLHREILRVLINIRAEPAQIVHHAHAAGSRDVVAQFAPVAARRALAVGSNREAYALYMRAAECSGHVAEPEQSRLFEELATTAYLLGRIDESIGPMNHAVALYSEQGDLFSVGRCCRILARFHWFAGHGQTAREFGQRAIDLLTPYGDSVELAEPTANMIS